MNTTDATKLYWQVKAVVPGEPNDLGPDMWAMLLREVNYADAFPAALKMLKESVFVGPVEICNEVKRIRAKRIADHGDLIPPAGLTVAEDVAWRREALRRVGNGEIIASTRGELKSRPPIPQLTKGMTS